MTTCQETVSKSKTHLSKQMDILKTYTVPSTYRYKQNNSWENEYFWKNVQNPKNNSKEENKNISEVELLAKNCVDSLVNEISKGNDLMLKEETEKINRSLGEKYLKVNNDLIQKEETQRINKLLCEKYFKIWKTCLNQKEQIIGDDELSKRQKDKLDAFVRRLKKQKKHAKIKKKDFIENCNEKSVQIKKLPKDSNGYKNRFEAQKSIIEMQKEKLNEQYKIIEELKFGIISKDIDKSMERAKINIREIFANCSGQIKYKIPLILGERPDFSVHTQSAPKIIKQIQQKALERDQNRQIIIERKRLIEETRQKMVSDAIEKKRILEEEEKKLNLELMKERRRKERELEMIRQTNKQIFMEKWNKAVHFYNILLMKYCLQKLCINLKISREKGVLAMHHYKKRLLIKCTNDWIALVEQTYKIKYEITDAYFRRKLLKRCFTIWSNVHLESIRNMQVAEDLYDFRLTSNTFIHWNRYCCILFMKQQKNIMKAENHFKRWLLFYYFYQWRSLKAVIQLEKAKERKKEKWRQKVWEILPDYKAPEKDF